MFSTEHFISIILFILFGWMILYLTRKFNKEQVKKLHIVTASIITLLEVIKISLRIYKQQAYDSWVPLYFCSLFIFAVWVSLSSNKYLSRMGYAYMTMGGIGASICFTLYPSTSFGMYPAWHPSTIYSFIFHLAMFITGVLALTKRIYEPKAKDGILYFIFIITACIPSVFINDALQTNCMFLRHPFQLPILQQLVDFSPILYIVVMTLFQSVIVFWGCFGIYTFINNKLSSKGEVK